MGARLEPTVADADAIVVNRRSNLEVKAHAVDCRPSANCPAKGGTGANPLDVQNGSIASILACPRHVRLWGNLGNAGCLVLPFEGIGPEMIQASAA